MCCTVKSCNLQPKDVVTFLINGLVPHHRRSSCIKPCKIVNILELALFIPHTFDKVTSSPRKVLACLTLFRHLKTRGFACLHIDVDRLEFPRVKHQLSKKVSTPLPLQVR